MLRCRLARWLPVSGHKIALRQSTALHCHGYGGRHTAMAKRILILPLDQRARVAMARVQTDFGEYIGMALPSLSS